MTLSSPLRLTVLCALLACAMLAHADRIHRAIEFNDYTKVKAMLEKTPALLVSRDEHERTPLQIAISRGAVAITRLLLEKGASVNAADTDGEVPLFSAAITGNEEIVKLLLQYKADPRAVDLKGNTFLHYAAMTKNLPIVKLAMEQGGMINSENDAGCTPLLCALGENDDRYADYTDRLAKEMRSLLLLLLEIVPEGDRQAIKDELAKMQETDPGFAVTKYLIEQGADFRKASNRGITPLLAAAKAGESAAVMLLVDKGADISVHDDDGRTFLHYAAASGDTSLVRMALEKGCPADARDDFRNTPLHFALDVRASGEMDFAGAFVNAFATMFSELIGEVSESLPDEVAKLIPEENRARVEALMKQRAEDPLLPLVTLLVDHGADVNAANIDGNLPIHGAAAVCGLATVKLLLAHGATLDKKNENGETVLHQALSGEKSENVKFFLEKGCPVNAQTRTGVTPLHLAAAQANSKLVTLLLSKGAKATIRDEDGKIPLHAALSFYCYGSGENEKIIAALVKAGSDVNARDEKGETLLHKAARRGMPDAVKQLLSHKAQVSLKNGEGKTPLMLAKEDLAEATKDKDTDDIARARKVITLLQKAGAK